MSVMYNVEVLLALHVLLHAVSMGKNSCHCLQHQIITKDVFNPFISCEITMFLIYMAECMTVIHMADDFFLAGRTSETQEACEQKHRKAKHVICNIK